MKKCIGTELPNGVTTYPHLVEDQALATQNSGYPLTRARALQRVRGKTERQGSSTRIG